MITCKDVIKTITDFAPLSLQESWDNSGTQVGDVNTQCTGVMLCLDVTEKTVAEAQANRCNLIISHHPLLFKGLRHITGATAVERAVIDAIRADITIFSAHTCLDSTIGGISFRMAHMLGAKVTGILSPSANDPSVGLGVICEFDTPIDELSFVQLVRQTFGSPVTRCTRTADRTLKRIALCGGAGGEFIPKAVSANAQAYLSSDIRYHDFVDWQNDIFLVDIGHFESESCAKDIFHEVITEKMPNFAVYNSQTEQNPINYL